VREETAFLESIRSEPADNTTRLVYADWLDEQGRSGEAEAVRGEVACRAVGAEATDLSDLVGKVLSAAKHEADRIVLTDSTGPEYVIYHRQDCCENVDIESVDGNIEDLLWSPITVAEESAESVIEDGTGEEKTRYESATRTTHRIATAKGEVTVLWFGSSNGYYSEMPRFEQLGPKDS
jgi:uncharacterized protein (TIGR02996 family)